MAARTEETHHQSRSRNVDDGPPSQADVLRVVEAILFVGPHPIAADQFAEQFPEIGAAGFEVCVATLRRQYRQQGRPYVIHRREGGFALALHSGYAERLQQRIRPERSATLGRPLLEALSVIAYRQPIAREEIERILGVDVRAALSQLSRRQLVGPHRSEGGDGKLFVTTARFLDVFGLESLADLPASEDLQSL